jgi:hypothetical protein
MDDIKLLIKGQEKNSFVIHYSCNGFYGGGSVAPTVCAIAIVNLKTNELHSFSLQDYIIQGKCLIEAEKQLLVDFINFFNNLKNPIFIHWNMTGLEYGFKAIRARCENFGFYDFSFNDLKTIDFNLVTSRSLIWLLKEYYCDSLDILSGKEELSCFEKRNYNAVKLSTEAKTKGLRKVVNLFLKDEIDFGIVYEE